MTERRVGRPPKKREAVVKVTLTLFHRQRVQLDRRVLDIQERQVSDIDRSAIIRALVDAVFIAGPDLTQAATEEEIVELVAEAFRGPGPGSLEDMGEMEVDEEDEESQSLDINEEDTSQE